MDPSTGSALGCAACHGDVSRRGTLPGTDTNLVSAPPVAPPNAPAYAVGAHLGHVNPSAASFLMAPIACAECHVVPTDSAHARNPPAQVVVFGAFTRTGGAAPGWTPVSAGCSATYCHGSFAFGVVSGANATPVWTSTAAMTCTSCHGMPPAGHFALPAPVTASTCAKCHPDTVNTDGTINATAKGHLNGMADTTPLSCTTCHGDAARRGTLLGTDGNLASAPPVPPTGAPSYAVGAHMAHSNPTAASYLMPPIACMECHLVPLDAGHATNPPPLVVVFGTLSKTGGALPTFVAGTAGCAATYCHGNFTFGTVKGAITATQPLLWTDTWTDSTKRACTSCHGMLPTGHPATTGLPTAASCFQCHPQSVNADGTIKVGGGHINGKIDGGGCTSCHGDPPATGKHGKHTKERCDGCHPTGYTSTTAIAPFHKNDVTDIGRQAGYSCGLKGCLPTGTCTVNCHGENHTAARW
jgi:predicted CxxxxCH...CXXCH cytochrome family protein